MNTQLSIFELPKPIDHRRSNGRYGTRLQAAIDEAAKWKYLYIAEITRRDCVAKTLRLQAEEIIRLKNR